MLNNQFYLSNSLAYILFSPFFFVTLQRFMDVWVFYTEMS